MHVGPKFHMVRTIVVKLIVSGYIWTLLQSVGKFQIVKSMLDS